jgi:hypothetical protein
VAVACEFPSLATSATTRRWFPAAVCKVCGTSRGVELNCTPFELAFTSSMLSTPEHAPATQNGVAPLQTLPQIPQLLVVVRSASQPLSGFPSQFPNEALHTGAQSKLPGAPTQALLPWALVQALPQLAQLVLVPSWVSQPGADVQSPKPAAQVPIVQVPVAHDALAFGNEQGTPQSPQSVMVVTPFSQPLSGSPSQLLKPAAQVGEQSKLPTAPVHRLLPWALVQALPHVAQFELLPSAVSQPGALVQSAKPGLQLTSVQVPVAHDSLAFGRSHTAPHAPQLPSEVRLVSQPLSGLPSQSFQPGSQVGAQSKLPGTPVQVLVPWALVQVLPQLAQLLVVPSWVSQPAAAVQSA